MVFDMSLNTRITLLSVILALGFAFFGVQKFGADNIVFETLASRSGIDLFEPLMRKFTGAAELVTAVLLLIPTARIKALAVLMAFGILSGAIVFHLSPWLGINVPGIGHFLFISAVALFILTLVLAAHLKKAAAQA